MDRQRRRWRIGAWAPADEGASGAGALSPSSLIGSGEIYIARDGTWYHEGAPFERLDLVKLFSGILRREADGTYWLKTPVEAVRVHVEDAPFVGQELDIDDRGEQRVLRVRTNLGEWLDIGADHPLRVLSDPDTGEPSPYVHVRRGLDALLTRAAFYHLADIAEPWGDGHRHGVHSHGHFFPLEPGG